MASKKRLWVAGVLLLLVLGLGLAASGCGSGGSTSEGSGEDIALSYTYAAGDSWVQDMTMVVESTTEGNLGESTETGATSETTKMRVTTTVKEVAEDGTATLSVSTETLERTIDGAAEDLTGVVPGEVTMTVDKTGKVLSTEGLDESGLSSALLGSGTIDPSEFGTQFSYITYPADGTAKVGEEWTSSSTMPLMDQELTVSTKFKLLSVSTENGRQVANIEYTTTLPMDLTLDLGALLQGMMQGLGGTDTASTESIAFKMTLKGGADVAGTSKVDMASGQAISNDGQGTMDMTIEVTEAPEDMVPADQRGPATVKMTMTITAVEAE